MLFLKWWQPSTWLSGVSDGVVGAVIKGLRSIFYTIISMLYKLIINLYWLFNTLCTGRLLDNTVMQELSKRIGLILGIIMFFYVTLSFIKMLIDPDIISDKTKGASAIVKKSILVIIMLGVSSFAFDTLYMVQRVVIQSNIISKILLPYDVNTDDFGGVLSAELLGTFYKISEGISDSDKESNTDVQLCQQVVYTLKEKIVEESDFELGNTCLNESVKIDQDDGETHEVTIIDFNWLLGIAAGIAVIYFLVVYCIKVGMRMIQLAILEIISPMAIVSYLAPKQDTMFSKWTKMYFSTYIDVFIRIAIINFAVFLIATIFDTEGNWAFWSSLNNPENKDIIMLVMIISLFAFAKKAPDLIKELLPSGASKLGFGGMHMKDVLGLRAGLNTAASVGTGAAIGFLGGAFSSGVAGYQKSGNKLLAVGHGIKGALGGGFGGAIHGIDNGLKAKNVPGAIGSSFKEQRSRNFRAADAISQGSTLVGRLNSSARRILGQNTRADNTKRNIDTLNKFSKIKDNIDSALDNNSYVKKLKSNYERIEQAGRLNGESDEQYLRRLEIAEQHWKNARLTAGLAGLNGNSEFSAYNPTTGYLENVSLDQGEVDVLSSYASQADELIKNNSSLFEGYELSRNGSYDYDLFKSTQGRAKSDAILLENSPEYATRQADDEFAYIPPDERLRRKGKK